MGGNMEYLWWEAIIILHWLFCSSFKDIQAGGYLYILFNDTFCD